MTLLQILGEPKGVDAVSAAPTRDDEAVSAAPTGVAHAGVGAARAEAAAPDPDEAAAPETKWRRLRVRTKPAVAYDADEEAVSAPPVCLSTCCR